MFDRLFSEFSGRFNRPHEVADDESQAVRLLQTLSQPENRAVEGWDPAQVEVACRTVAASLDGSISRIQLVFPCPLGPTGAISVANYARAVASRTGLRAHCMLRDGMLTVTIERQGG